MTGSENTMTTKDTLQAHVTRLAWELKQAEEVKAEADKARQAYDEAITVKLDALRKKLESEHAGVVTQVEAAKKRQSEVAERVEAHRNQIKGLLTYNGVLLFGSDNKKPLPGIGRRDSIKAVYNEATAFSQLLRSAPFLLKIDDKAVQDFAKQYGKVNSSGEVEWPEHMAEMFETITLKQEHQWTISDKTLLKEAPDTEPAA